MRRQSLKIEVTGLAPLPEGSQRSYERKTSEAAHLEPTEPQGPGEKNQPRVDHKEPEPYPQGD